VSGDPSDGKRPLGSVMLVEDDLGLRDILAEILRQGGFEVRVAANGQEALDALRRLSPPCVILLDLLMPVMNGWQFRTQQRADPALATIPVVAISADHVALRRASELGVAAQLRKPIDNEDLIEIVRRFCR
jgi:CheY-like chemotaxis protein